MILVLDASVAIKFYLPEVFAEEADRLLDAGHRFHVPELVYPEFSSVVWKKVLKSELRAEKGLEVIRAFVELNFVTHPHRDLVLSAYTGADATGQTVYDWTYLALAISLSCKFVTADERFFKAIEETVFRENMLWIEDV